MLRVDQDFSLPLIIPLLCFVAPSLCRLAISAPLSLPSRALRYRFAKDFGFILLPIGFKAFWGAKFWDTVFSDIGAQHGNPAPLNIAVGF